ncbi:hypothetical protein DL93DRAFT_2092126 [Clavulina sp. PMI_390]|nr:hypothetical protein DL93DRAFT_2092126 [Clavulina sp. PMI_390]
MTLQLHHVHPSLRNLATHLPPYYPSVNGILPVYMVMTCHPSSELITATHAKPDSTSFIFLVVISRMSRILETDCFYDMTHIDISVLSKNKCLRLSEWCRNKVQTWTWNGILGSAAAISTIIATVLVIAWK